MSWAKESNKTNESETAPAFKRRFSFFGSSKKSKASRKTKTNRISLRIPLADSMGYPEPKAETDETIKKRPRRKNSFGFRHRGSREKSLLRNQVTNATPKKMSSNAFEKGRIKMAPSKANSAIPLRWYMTFSFV